MGCTPSLPNSLLVAEGRTAFALLAFAEGQQLAEGPAAAFRADFTLFVPPHRPDNSENGEISIIIIA